jgi:hypothetical protein
LKLLKELSKEKKKGLEKKEKVEKQKVFVE